MEEDKLLDSSNTTSIDLDLPDINHMSDSELLEAVWEMESLYKKGDYTQDHRRHLSRTELENVFRLVQRRLNLRAHFRNQRH